MAIFTLIFSIGISLFCFWASIKLILLYFKINSWSKLPAIVISKKIELHKKVSTKNSPYAVRIEYKYVVNGKEYTNNTVFLVELLGGQANQMESSAKKIINELKDNVIVFVDPKDPQRSVLIVKGIGMYVLIFFFGIVSLLIGLSNYF